MIWKVVFSFWKIESGQFHVLQQGLSINLQCLTWLQSLIFLKLHKKLCCHFLDFSSFSVSYDLWISLSIIYFAIFWTWKSWWWLIMKELSEKQAVPIRYSIFLETQVRIFSTQKNIQPSKSTDYLSVENSLCLSCYWLYSAF